ncbi:MAG: hypothetical protein COA70_12910 [Planctomycetota bacterium]|nr:MAG: hypothetical protein COA70_12910 [Planctomycetota bacterium]
MELTPLRELVFLLEEPSAKDLLKGLLPRIISPAWTVRYIVFEGKQALEKRMMVKLSTWLTPGTLFVILRDQDSGNCVEIKDGLAAKCLEAGKGDALVRIACRELESWVVGDLEAFAEEFSCPQASRRKRQRKFQQPDNLGSPVEELRKFVPSYQKRDGARRMGHLLNPESNRSVSFRVFCDGVRRIAR